VLVQQLRGVFALTDQHLLAFISELLKMSSVADGEMNDSSLRDIMVDKNGYVVSAEPVTVAPSTPALTHASSVFHRRLCVIKLDGASMVVPEQCPAGVQLRASTIVLLHALIRSFCDDFFDAEQATPVGKSCGRRAPSHCRTMQLTASFLSRKHPSPRYQPSIPHSCVHSTESCLSCSRCIERCSQFKHG
jgi:hypothetical protein